MLVFFHTHHRDNSKLLEFRYTPLQLEEELDMLFIDNNVTGENAWVLTRVKPMPEGQLTMIMITKVIQSYGVIQYHHSFRQGG